MKIKHICYALLALFISQIVFATEPTDSVSQTLAPSGELQVGVYLGSPTSMVIDPSNAEVHGVAFELGQSLAKSIHRPVRIVKFERVSQVIEALKKGEVDFTFTNATAARSKDLDFTNPLIRLELGLLVPNTSPVKKLMDINETTFHLGVTKGSSSQGVLGAKLSQVQIIPVESLDQAQQMLISGELDGYATNKGILFELNEHLSGFKVLDDRWGLENLAIAIPKGREQGLQYLTEFAKEKSSSGEIEAIAKRAGLRGLAKD